MEPGLGKPGKATRGDEGLLTGFLASMEPGLGKPGKEAMGRA